jgi:hypothetical protein
VRVTKFLAWDMPVGVLLVNSVFEAQCSAVACLMVNEEVRLQAAMWWKEMVCPTKIDVLMENYTT